ncbi:MAG: SLOG family protein, partial [Lactobacillus iners]|nr:SLOG family protein [Lactobacillus iners]
MHCIWISGYRNYELNVFNNNDPKIKVIKIAVKNYLQQKLEDRCLDWVIAGPNLGV